MKKSLLLVFTLLFFSGAGQAQQKQDCRCLANLQQIIGDIENNYPGYPAKTAKGQKKDYLRKKYNALNQAAKALDRRACFDLISKYLGYFRDNHIIFTDIQTNPKKSSADRGKIDDQDPLTGTWANADSSATIEIFRQSSSYVGYKRPDTNSVYFELFGKPDRFRIRKHQSWLTTDMLRGRLLGDILIEPQGIWYRHGQEKNSRTASLPMEWNKHFNHQLLDSQTYYLGIPAFDTNETKFDSIIVHHVIPALQAHKAEHLIIDLRNNVGGNSSFLSLLRLTFEKPFAIPGDFIFAGPAMIDQYTKKAADGSKLHATLLPKLMANRGSFVQRDSLRVRLGQGLDQPSKISIIVNDNCASSTEYFLILAKQSQKVRIFGRNTAGTLDYSELHAPLNLPCRDYRYMRPTTKSFYTDRQPIDNVGIRPDIDLSAHSENTWVDIVRKHP